MYVNLELELFRQDMTVHKLAKLLCLRETALYDKLNGKDEFKFSEAVKIKRILNTWHMPCSVRQKKDIKRVRGQALCW